MDSVNWSALNWSALVAALAFVSAQISGVAKGFFELRRERSNLAKALLAEIRSAIANGGEVQTPESFAAFCAASSVEQIGAFSFVSFVPKVYNANVGKMGLFPRELVEKIVTVYAILERMNGFIVHGKSKELLGSTPEIQRKMVDLMVATIGEIHELHGQLRTELSVYIK